MFNRKVVLVLENCELLVIFKDGEKRFIDDVELYGHNSGSDICSICFGMLSTFVVLLLVLIACFGIHVNIDINHPFL